MRNLTREFIKVALLGLLIFTAVGHAQEKKTVVQGQTAGGVSTTTFDVGEGKIVVRLPDDMRAGDTISGTVVASPAGNTGSLDGYVLDIAGNKGTPIAQELFMFIVPTGRSSLPMSVRNITATEVGRTEIPIRSTKSEPPSDFVLPRLGQAGRDLAIPGPFDGNASTTHINVGGTQVPIIAESPRKIIVRAPEEPIGSTNILVNENGQTRTREFRNIGLTLSAPKTNLRKGEKTTITVTVTGLEGIKDEVRMNLVTTGAVNMQGANVQQIRILPTDVGAKGNATYTRTITGVKPGSFNVTATIVVP